MKDELLTNYAFIDGQNIHLGMVDLGWKLDWGKFRNHLRMKYRVRKAYYFIGYMKQHTYLYTSLRNAGYELVYKDVVRDKDGKPKGNVDVELACTVLLESQNYERAVVITSDGDFSFLVKHLVRNNKLEVVVSPSHVKCSSLLKKAAGNHIRFLINEREKLERTHKK